MEEREYIVILKKGVNYDEFWDEIENESSEDNFIPSRRVDIINERPGSLRSCHYSLTDDEAEKLKNDPRIYDVEIPPYQRDDIEIGFNAIQEGDWRKTNSTFNTDLNWGLLRGVNSSDPWSGSTSITDEYPYTLTGYGVDIVIQDSGVTTNHSEWLDENGNSRYQSIDWYEASGLSGSQDENHDRDIVGHGSHCAGIAAGKTYGWAKNANIYSLKVRGLESLVETDTTGISVTDCFDAIKLWHRNKPIDPNTGFKRPTVVNMSWSYGTNRTSTVLANGTYRGTSWTSSTTGFTTSEEQYASAGIVVGKSVPKTRRVNVRVSSVDADLEELIDEGVHVCIAAGNTYYYIASDGDSDWNNIGNFGGLYYYYHRGASPYSTNAFMVGNIDIEYQNGLEHKAESSCCGPGVDIYAPGTEIISVSSKDKYGFTCELGSQEIVYVTETFSGSGYNIMKLSGSSMASPNVAGMIATILEANPGMTPAEMKTFIHNNATQNLLYDGTTDDWDDEKSIQGGPNRIFKTPFVSSKNLKISNAKISNVST